MKFPYELSELQLTLLSKEDQFEYLYEHSIYYSATLKELALQSIIDFNNGLYESELNYLNDINDDVEFEDCDLEEKHDMAKKLSKVEAASVFSNISDIFKEAINEEDGITLEEYNAIEKYMINQIAENGYIEIPEDDMKPLDEVNDWLNVGKDWSYWLPNMGWLGKAALGIFGLLLSGLVGLLIAGKDKLAAKLLQRYMNKIVEYTDNGQNRRQTIFSLFGAKNSGDQSQGCLRSIQENVERNRYTMGLVWAKAAGLISCPEDAVSNSTDTGGIGLEFNKNISNKLKLFLSKVPKTDENSLREEK